jgi:hypothetical protein
MTFFVGLSYNSFFNVNDYRGSFATREAALKELGTSVTILPHEVRGDYQYPNKIYVASRYSRRGDLFDFVGLFAGFNLAAQAAGEPNLILEVDPPQN